MKIKVKNSKPQHNSWLHLRLILHVVNTLNTFAQENNLIANHSNKDCVICGDKEVVSVLKRAKQNISIKLKCESRKNKVSAAMQLKQPHQNYKLYIKKKMQSIMTSLDRKNHGPRSLSRM